MHVAPLLRKQDVSVARRRLLELCQRLNFGRIADFEVRCGEPRATPLTKVFRELKFPGDNGPRLETAKTDFVLKAQVLELFAAFDALGDGLIESLEVKHGLPFRVSIADDAAF